MVNKIAFSCVGNQTHKKARGQMEVSKSLAQPSTEPRISTKRFLILHNILFAAAKHRGLDYEVISIGKRCIFFLFNDKHHRQLWNTQMLRKL